MKVHQIIVSDRTPSTAFREFCRERPDNDVDARTPQEVQDVLFSRLDDAHCTLGTPKGVRTCVVISTDSNNDIFRR